MKENERERKRERERERERGGKEREVLLFWSVRERSHTIVSI